MSKVDVLKSYVPDFISESFVFNEIYNTQGTEIDSMDVAVSDILNQCFVDSATWTLKKWEGYLGIPIDESKPYDYRRSVIKSKIRGIGTVTVELIKSVAESYQNGTVDVIEHTVDYSFEIKFVDEKGIPPNINDLKAAIEQIKPAHLGVTYSYRYNTYQYLQQFTHSQLAAYTHNNLREVI